MRTRKVSTSKSPIFNKSILDLFIAKLRIRRRPIAKAPIASAPNATAPTARAPIAPAPPLNLATRLISPLFVETLRDYTTVFSSWIASAYPLSEPIRKLASDSRPPASQDDNGDMITSGKWRHSIRTSVRQRRCFFPGTLERNPQSSFSGESPTTGNRRPENAITDVS